MVGILRSKTISPLRGLSNQWDFKDRIRKSAHPLCFLPFAGMEENFSHLFWRPFAILRLITVIRQWHIDVLHVNDYWWAPLGILAGRLTGCPCLVHVRQEIEPRKISQYWLNRGSLIVPVSESIGNVMKECWCPS